ncbi:hypothetical protein [Thermanaeromonas toyohensis]|nr:hypothetical protein [Thermanaeromonas toyohensis]
MVEGISLIEKAVLGLSVLCFVFGLGQLVLKAALAPVCGQYAGLVADSLAFCAGFLVLAGGHGIEVLTWAADLAGRLLGSPEMYHSGGAVAELRWLLDRAVWQLQSVL